MSEPSSKKPYVDNVTKNFLENLQIEKPLYEMDVEGARNYLLDLQGKYYHDIEASVEDISIFSPIAGEISMRLVRPSNSYDKKLPLVIYCHGGGWVLGDAECFDMTIKTIATWTDSVVAFINYPRSPEFAYPDALTQVCEAINLLYENASNYGIDAERIALVGDSAGGNLVAAAAIKNNFEGEVKICFQALLYPVVDAEMKTDSYKEFKNGPWLSKKTMEYFWDAYVQDKEERKNIYVSPLRAETEYLKDLPPTLIITAENDILRDEGEEYARKLIEADVETVCVRFNNAIHDFMLLNGLRESMATKGAYKLLCKFLKHALHK